MQGSMGMKYSKWDSVVDYVSNNLIQEIEENDYQVGNRFLTEREICEKYKVGRSSAREALRILETTGWIETIRGKGAFVARSSRDSTAPLKEWFSQNSQRVESIIQARILMEPPMVAQVAQTITDGQLEGLQKTCDALDIAYEEHNVLGAVALDEQFHIALVDLYGNEFISRFNAELQKASSFYRAQTYHVSRIFSEAQHGHQALMCHLKAHDSEKAEDELRRHIAAGLGYFIEATEND